MSMETLEFIIYPDGRVKETVTGIVGASCQKVTAAIEAQLGVVISQEKTSEYFQQQQETYQSIEAKNRATFSDWRSL
jgi:fructose/tagatose bisphosphate aldolase